MLGLDQSVRQKIDTSLPRSLQIFCLDLATVWLEKGFYFHSLKMIDFLMERFLRFSSNQTQDVNPITSEECSKWA